MAVGKGPMEPLNQPAKPLARPTISCLLQIHGCVFSGSNYHNTVGPSAYAYFPAELDFATPDRFLPISHSSV